MYSYFLSAFFVRDVFDILWLVLGSTFMSTAIVALIGAGGGAYIADRIATKKELTRQKEQELNAVLTGLAMVSSIVNTVVQLKLQHLDRLVSEYNSQRKEFLDLRDAVALGEKTTLLEHDRDLQDLPKLTTPVVILQNMIYEKIELAGKKALYVTQLVQALHNLAEAIDKRATFVERYKATTWSIEGAEHALFFGLPTDDVIDATYPTLIEALEAHADASYYFAKFLHDALIGRAQILRNQLKRHDLKIHAVHFVDFEERLALSDVGGYDGWLDTEVSPRVGPASWRSWRVFRRFVIDQQYD